MWTKNRTTGVVQGVGKTLSEGKELERFIKEARQQHVK